MIALRKIDSHANWGPAVAALAFAMMLLVCLVAVGATELLSDLTNGKISIWLPTGAVMAAMVSTRYSRWPLWALAGGLAEGLGNIFWYGHTWGPASLLIVGNLSASISGAWLIRRMLGPGPFLCSVRDCGALLSVTLLIMPLISATLCSLALGWSYDRSPIGEWPRVFLGDATGAVIAAPITLLLLGKAASWPRMHRTRWIEAATLTIVFASFTALAMGGIFPLVFILLIPTLWAALRFRIVGAILVSTALALFSALLTAAEISPFGPSALYGQYGPHGLQIFLMVVAASSLMVGAIAEENRSMFRRLADSNRTLESRVEERSALLAASEARANESSRLLSAIGEACPDLIFAKDLDLRLIYANAATLAALGKEGAEAVIGYKNEDIIPDAGEAALIRHNDETVLRTGQTLIAEEPVTIDGQNVRIFRATKAPLFGSDGALVGLAGVCVDITEIKQAAVRERLLVREIEHRARNLLAVLQSVIQLTEAPSVKDFRTAISRRLQALARTHASISASNWEGASFRSLLLDEFAPFLGSDKERVRLIGDDLFLDTGTAQTAALIIHELATNAAKYGALSVNSGHILIDWTVAAVSPQASHLIISWQESDGPPVQEPKKLGFGSTVISMLSREREGGSADYQWRTEGLCVRIILPLEKSDAGEA